jgi:ubiquinone/menaquinone biosynthesis C-methylase UbiE
MTLGPWYSNIFARIYDPFMHKIEGKIFAHKRHYLLHQLSGNILDVGSGTGANFSHFSNKANVTALEPNGKMMDYASSKLPVHATVKLVLGGVGDKQTNFEENTFDYIVSTLVLCTIPNPELAFEHFKKWLKPNGKLILIEHIRSHNHVTGMAQDVINPVWKLAADGCNLNRNTDQMVKDAGFEAISENYFHVGFKWFEGTYQLINTEG